MSGAIKLSPQDAARLAGFYDSVHSGTRPSSPDGKRLTAAELEDAKATLAGASAEARATGWRNVIDAVGSDMDAGFLGTMSGELANVPKSVRPQNGYLLAASRRRIADSGLMAEVAAAAELAAGKAAMKAAIDSQVAGGDGMAARAKGAMMRLVDRVQNPAELELMAAAWPVAAEAGVNPTSIAAIENALEAVRSGTTPEVAVADLSAELGVTAAPAGDIHRQLEALIEKHGTRRLLVDQDKIRVEAYRKTVRKVMNDPVVERILPKVRAAMAEDEEMFRLEQAAGGGLVLDKDSLDLAVGLPYADELYALTQEVGKKLGFMNEVTLVITPSVSPNAFIYTANQDKPRVTFYTPMVEKFWDNRTNDWIKIFVDADGKPTDKSTPGVREVSVGKLMVESVLAHELGHIRDEIMLTQAVAIYALVEAGKNLLGSLSKDEDKQKLKQIMAEAENLFGGEPLLGKAGEPGLSPRLRELFHEQAMVSAEEANALVAEFTGKEKGAALTLEDVFAFKKKLAMMSRAAEATADRYAVTAQGNPEWTALMDAILGIDYATGTSDRQKIRSVEHLMRMGPEAFADKMLARLNPETPDHLAFNEGRSHPTTAVRIKQDFMYARDAQGLFQQLEAYQDLKPAERVLAVIQLHEKKIAALAEKIAEIEPHRGYHLLEDTVRRQGLEKQLTGVRAAMQPYVGLFDRVIGPRGWLDADNERATDALAFMKKKGIELGDQTPFAALIAHCRDQVENLLAGPVSDAERATGEARLTELEALAAAAVPKPQGNAADVLLSLFTETDDR